MLSAALLLLLSLGSSLGLMPAPRAVEGIGRRVALLGAAALLAPPSIALARGGEPRIGAAVNDLPDNEVPPSQLAMPGKIDVNNALVTDYKRLPGMYPHAAGLIASHGPYQSVRDLAKIPGANENDKRLFVKYASELVALPPGRMFNERINARQST